jgi:hypothetical protein
VSTPTSKHSAWHSRALNDDYTIKLNRSEGHLAVVVTNFFNPEQRPLPIQIMPCMLHYTAISVCYNEGRGGYNAALWPCAGQHSAVMQDFGAPR